MNIQDTSLQRDFNRVASIQKCQNIRYDWEYDFNQNYKTYSSEFATRVFEALKKTFALYVKVSFGSLPTIENKYTFHSIDFLDPNTFIKKSNLVSNLEPFCTWSKNWYSINDVDYFHNLMKKIGNQALIQLSDSCKNYFSPHFDCELKIVNYPNGHMKLYSKASIETSVWFVNKSNIDSLSKFVSVSIEKNKIDLNGLLLEAEKAKCEWQKQFNANHKTFALEMAELYCTTTLENLAARIENPYKSLQLNEEFEIIFNVDINNEKINNIIEIVATKTKIEPFYYWNSENVNVSVLLKVKDGYYYKSINEVFSKAIQQIPELLQNKLQKDFKCSCEEYYGYNEEKYMKIKIWMVSIPISSKKQPVVVQMTEDLWIKKNN